MFKKKMGSHPLNMHTFLSQKHRSTAKHMGIIERCRYCGEKTDLSYPNARIMWIVRILVKNVYMYI